jgi:hypothetical protein
MERRDFRFNYRIKRYSHWVVCGAENMTKGKPWDIEEIRQLRKLVDDGKSVEEISRIMVKTLDSIKQKMFDLKLKEKRVHGGTAVFSSSLELPKDLPSVEDSLRTLSAALKALETPGLDQAEVLRLRGIISGVKIYKEIFADFLNYCELEGRLSELEGKYAELTKSKERKTDASA